ncbi:MAG: gamma-glutamyl kinase [Pseudomonadota bacterium]
MLISLRHRLVLLAQTKCASTALAAALAPRMDIVIRGHPKAKHSNLRRFDRCLRGYCEEMAGGPVETVAMIREPVDWLRSWWRYRSRAALVGTARSTQGMSFDAFARVYLSGDGRDERVQIGRQARFLSRADGAVGVDHLFRLEELTAMTTWLAGRTGWDVALERRNGSPPPPGDPTLSSATRRLAEEILAEEYRLWHEAAR